MNKIKRPDKIILFILSIMMLFCSVIAINYISKSKLKNVYSSYSSYEDNWYDEDNNLIDISEFDDDSCIIHKQLNNIVDSANLFFTAKNYLVTITVDDKIIYQTKLVDTFAGKTAGVEIVSVNLSEKYNDKMIYIDLKNPYEDGKGSINDLQIGGEVDNYSHFLLDRYFESCMCIICIALGIMLIILYFPLSKKKIISSRLFYLGIFTLNFGIFMYTDSKVLQLICDNEFVFHTIAQLWMHLLAIPALFYFDRIFEEKNNKVSLAICIYSIVTFILCMIFNVLGIYDLHETISYVHLGYIFCFAYLIGLFIKHRYSFKKYRIHIVSIGILLISVSIDLALLHLGGYVDTSTYTRVGVLVFLIIELINTLWEKLSEYQLEVKMEFLSSLAYHDGLTNLLNRTSFIEALESLTVNKDDILIAMFDVNDLKVTNDTLGHSVGDELIITASNAIETYPGKFGKTYRIGGDEFVVIIENQKLLNDLIESLKNMDKFLESINKQREYNISIAYGYACYDSTKHKDLNDTFNEADQLMYKHKRKIKDARKKN